MAVNYDPTAQNDFLLLFLVLLPMVIWLFMFVMAIAVYVLRSYGLFKMAKNTAMLNPLLAFVPIAHEYLAAKMADRGNAALGKKTNYSKWVIISNVVMAEVGILVFVQFLLMLFVEVFPSEYSMDSMIVFPMLLFFMYYLLLMLSSLATVVLQTIFHYCLYRDFEPESAVLYTALTVLGLDAICKLLISNSVPVSIAGRYPMRQPKYRA